MSKPHTPNVCESPWIEVVIGLGCSRWKSGEEGNRYDRLGS